MNYQFFQNNERSVNQHALDYPYVSRIVALSPTTLHPLAIYLYPSLEIHFLIEKKHCPNCLTLLENDKCRICPNLDLKDDLPLSIRTKCNYREFDSPLIQKGYCTFNSFPCGFIQNRDTCHSTYFLYIGRFNSLFKVGISRMARTKKKRLLEQGLNEAFVVSPLKGLPEALKLEQTISEMISIPDRLKSEEKCQSFISDASWDWNSPKRVLNELAHSFQIEYFKFLDDFRVKKIHRIHLKEDMKLFGKIVWIQGPWAIIAMGDEAYGALYLKDLMGYQLVSN